MYKISYVSDGVMTEFDFRFPFFQIADIRVAINENLSDVNFAVVPKEDFSGGRVVFDIPLPVGDKIDIFRKISLSRIIDYQPTKIIDPEDLNTDFNFLLAAFQDLNNIEIDLSEWQNTHDNIKSLIDYTLRVIEDKLSGGAVLGLYRNLISVLESALPNLINDYGFVSELAPNEIRDDYGIL